MRRSSVAHRADGPRQSAARTATRPSAADHAICRGVSRVSRRGQRHGRRPLRRRFQPRFRPPRGRGPGWTVGRFPAPSAVAADLRPTRRAHRTRARPCGRDPKHATHRPTPRGVRLDSSPATVLNSHLRRGPSKQRLAEQRSGVIRCCGIRYDRTVPNLRIRQAAELLGVSDDTVRRWINHGTLAVSHDAAGRKVIASEDLAEFCPRPTRPHRRPDPLSIGSSARNRFVGLVTEGRPATR